MRIIVVVAMLLWGLPAAVSPALAADLDRGLLVERCDPAYYGTAPPWSVQEERPPRKGVWYFTAPLPPGVNFLVPMGAENCFGRPAPWTPAWYSYCAARWPSFNPKTGTIVTPDGVRMCI